ncbi:MAG: hypothetical protein KDJ65_11555 [Anaerolineae bacterium]|nr:hypothetical protein [Anaerolineae bacterium]
MTDIEYFNDPIAITATIGPTGEVRPRHFDWREQQYAVVSVGRQWEAEDGRHILVEIPNGDRFELHLAREDLRWRLIKGWRRLAMV